MFPQEGLEVAGLATFGVIMALCTVAGIGGGGVANSMLIYFFKFETKPAVAISSFSILVCTTFRFFYNFNSKHPDKAKSHINVLDYGLASIMMPTTLAGSQIGGYILLLFPSIYIQIALTLLLAFLTYQTTVKGIQLHKKEVAEMDKKAKVGAGEHDDANFYEVQDAPMSINDNNNDRLLNESGDDIEPLSVLDGKVHNKIVIGGQTFTLGEN